MNSSCWERSKNFKARKMDTDWMLWWPGFEVVFNIWHCAWYHKDMASKRNMRKKSSIRIQESSARNYMILKYFTLCCVHICTNTSNWWKIVEKRKMESSIFTDFHALAGRRKELHTPSICFHLWSSMVVFWSMQRWLEMTLAISWIGVCSGRGDKKRINFP